MPDRLIGPARAAAFLSGMPAEEAAEILALLDPDERRQIEAATASLGLTPEECRAIASDRPFAALDRCPTEALAGFLQQQHPQVSVTILRELPEETGERAFNALLPHYRGEVLKRLRSSRRPSPAILAALDRAASEHLEGAL
jgi:flagellar motor switch protein FliG